MGIELMYVHTHVHVHVILHLYSTVAYAYRYPYPPWRDDNFVIVIQNQFPLLLMLSFVFTMLQIVKDVVHEKERKIKARHSVVY